MAIAGLEARVLEMIAIVSSLFSQLDLPPVKAASSYDPPIRNILRYRVKNVGIGTP